MPRPHSPDGPAGNDAGSRAHSLLGVLPLTAYACFHLWRHWPALESRDAWVQRAQRWQLGAWFGVLVLLLLVAHAVLGWRKQRGESGQPTQPTRHALAGFQRFTGTLLLGFTVYHVLQVWPPSSGAHASLHDAYDELWVTLGTPAVLIAYVLGVSALAFHLGTGWSRFAARAWPAVSPRVFRYAAGLLGMLFWLGYLQLVGRFAVGEALVPFGAAGTQVGPPATQPPLPSM
jgi:succinate dehydrogenase/fumarate reductase cytochrome b subunit